MQGGKKMQMVVDFFLGWKFSVILIFLFFFFWWKWDKFKRFGLYFYHLVTFGLVHFINQSFVLEWFGCGCVPVSQENKLHIPINANDVTRLYYFICLLFLLFFAIKESRGMEKRVLYIASVMIVNLFFSFIFIQMMMWM